MIRSKQGNAGGVCAPALLSCIGLMLCIMSCSTAPQAFVVQGGGGVTGNEPPTMTIIDPTAHLTRGRGDSFVVYGVDSDRYSNASISLVLVGAGFGAGSDVVLVENIPENDSSGIDSWTVNTETLPLGTFNIMGVISDGVNTPVTAFAQTAGTGTPQFVVVTIVETGQGPPTVPPVITVTEPAFDLSVSQDDVLRVAVQPTQADPVAGVTRAFDPDSEVTLFVLLDTDLNPNNDDPANPDPANIIVLASRSVPAGNVSTDPFDISIDLAQIPSRPDGAPYFVRVSVDDSTNPRVHEYAVGTINVSQLASGVVDLRDVGRTTSGARFQGFNTGGRLGSSFSYVDDFDADGVDDFVMVARFGNPRNFGQIGEAYLVYGQNGIRFGGRQQVNTVSERVSGAIFTAPPIRTREIPSNNARTEGITDVSFIRDLTEDGRPELLFGMPHVHGAFDSTDFDPGDDQISIDETTVTVAVSIRQGETSVAIGNEDPELSFEYRGMDDLTISSVTPGTPAGSDPEMSWRNVNDTAQEWTLIKFQDVLSEIPDLQENIDITSIRARLRLRIFATGGDAEIHQCLTDFTESTTFTTFSVTGGAPAGGDRDASNVDYVVETGGGAGGLGSITGDTAEQAEVDISDLVRELVDGRLADRGNELRFILVPQQIDGNARTSVRSSEFPSVPGDRPTLLVDYTRINFAGESSCYPDLLVNNQTNEPDELRDDVGFYAGGMATMFNSQNRDNNGEINPNRMDSVSGVDLELIGQRAAILDSGSTSLGGTVFPRVDTEAAAVTGNDQIQEGRIAGARFVAGPFDFIDADELRQGPREGLFGQTVASLGDMNNDGTDEIMISAPRNERYLEDMLTNFGFSGTHWASTRFDGSILVLPGINYNLGFWRDKNDSETGTATIPALDQHRFQPFGTCNQPPVPREQVVPADHFQVFAEDIDDWLGGARSAGDFNQDGLDDILCGAPRNDLSPSEESTGALYILYGRNVAGDFDLSNADDPFARPRMLRLRGETPGDQVGWEQSAGLDVNGDRIGDIFISSPFADFPLATAGGPEKATCGVDRNDDGVISAADFDAFSFNACRTDERDILISDTPCARDFDYNNDGFVDDVDETVFRCLQSSGGADRCCDGVTDNGFAAIIFGGVTINGDRRISQIATSDLPGVVFYGAAAGHRAGFDVASAGDFNQDGFGDILISVPGETRVDRTGQSVRKGVVYLIFGGTHLNNTSWSLSQVGSRDLPGIVFLSPYAEGGLNEAAPEIVGFVGDINNDGFGDIAIGNQWADFVDEDFPPGPGGDDQAIGRLRNAGDIYLVYGNNFGSNRANP